MAREAVNSPYPETVQRQALAFFDTAYESFLSNKEGSEKFYRIAGFVVRFRLARGSPVDFLTAALAHLEVRDQPCDLTICVWDSSKTPSLELPWRENFYDLRGEVLQYNTERIYTVRDIHTNALNLFDKERCLALYWIADFQDLPWWVRGSPFQLIFHWWLRGQGHQLTHAAVVGYERGGVLLAGKSGSGKSTTALVCMRAGMRYVSEDYCVLSDGPEVWGYSIYNSAKLEEATLLKFPSLSPHIANPQRKKGDKALVFHHLFQPEKILLGLPLKALLILQVEKGADSWLEPIDLPGAVAALAVSTMWQLTHTGPAVFHHLRRVAQEMPRYHLHLGSDLSQIPQIIEALL